MAQKSAAQLDREIASALAGRYLTNPDGTRNTTGKMLAAIARTSPAGLDIPKSPEIRVLIDAGYVVYGLHPRGGYRANVTALGRDALAHV